MRPYGSMIFVLVFIAKSTGESLCLASENKRWKMSQGKCVDCQQCPAGKARNFTEPYVGRSVQFGDTQCLPCRKCHEGFYAGDIGCLPCRVFCDTDYFREFDRYCEESQDAWCGSCLFGYEDSYRNIKFPCTKRDKHETVGENLHVDETDVTIRDKLNMSRQEIGSAVHDERNLNTTKNRTITIMIMILIGTAIIIIIPAFVFLVTPLRKYFRRKPKSENTKQIDDLQTDGAGSNFSSLDEVRGELTTATPLLRPELSTGANTQPIAVIADNFNTNQPFQYVETSALPCGCMVDPSCQCFKLNIPNIEIEKSDKFVIEVSTSICHSPDELFDALDLSYSVIFPIEEDRRLDPAGITYQDKMLRVLNKWVEVKPTSVTLHTLMKALCRSNFHRINYRLKQNCLHEYDILENDDGRMT